jgi:filamentous hemagglutinin family protein
MTAKPSRINVAVRAILGVAASSAAVTATWAAAPHAAPAPGALPTPCSAATCPAGAAAWLASGNATHIANGSTLQIHQTTPGAVLNWSSFDVGTAAKVIFNQPTSTSTTLNEIFAAKPSQIFGMVKANGQIYLINGNGLVFGPKATVNVGGLLASTLDLVPAAQTGGLLNPALVVPGLPALVAAPSSSGASPAAVPAVVVDQGAQISTNGPNERVMLAGGAVDNAGTLSAPDGQVVLAAGSKIFLQASTDQNLRGLIVEVDGGGSATNAVAGTLTADRGNVSMVGLAVNQLGRVSATTSVTANGSVRLVAGDTIFAAATPTGAAKLERQRGGALTLGPASTTSILPDATSATAVDGVPQAPSIITMEGAQILVEPGSHIRAPDGQLLATARLDPSLPPPATSDGATIRVDPGAVIDLSGSADSVPVSRNIVPVQLRATELADDPEQRNGKLRGQTVYVDARVGTPIADVSGEVGLIQRDIYERTSAGGSATFDSSGDIVVASGAKLNVSGGSVRYTPGWIQTSELVTAGGAMVNIGTANPAQTYLGVVNPTITATDNRWGAVTVTPLPGLATYDPGYVDGKPGGSLEFLAPTMVLSGTFIGGTQTGARQRAAGAIVPGGQFLVGVTGPIVAAQPPSAVRGPAIEVVEAPTPIVVADNAPLPSPLTLQLAASTLTESGFSNIELASNDHISIGAGVPLALVPQASLTLLAPRILVGSSIAIPGGSLTLESFTSALQPPNASSTAGVFIGDGVTVDLRGNWTNDFVLPQGVIPTSPVVLNGGSIVVTQEVTGGTLSLGTDDRIDVSGGAWLNRGDKIKPGAGGSIVLNSGPSGTFDVGAGTVMSGFSAVGGKGGSFSLAAPRINITRGGAAWAAAQQVASDPSTGDVLDVSASLFSNNGFSNFLLDANSARIPADPSGAVLAIQAGTVIDLSAKTYSFTSQSLLTPSAANLAGLLTAQLAPQYLRAPLSVTLNALVDPGGSAAPSELGTINVAAGAEIIADAGSSVSFGSFGKTLFNGTIRAPAGSVSFTTFTPLAPLAPSTADGGFDPALSIELGSKALIDVAGTTVYQPNNAGLLVGSVLGGGSVSLMAQRGSVITDRGSDINFSGTQGALDLLPPGSNAAPTLQTAASAGGSLSVAAPESISLLGNIQGAAGVGTTGRPPGGTLSITLSRVALPGWNPGTNGLESTYPAGPRTIDLAPDAEAAVEPAQSGVATLNPATIAASGVDALVLSADQVQLSHGASLALGREIILQTPSIGVDPNSQIKLTAPYVALGTGLALYPAAAASAGTGTITISGTQSMDLMGSLAFTGASAVTLRSGGVIQLRGNELGDAVTSAGSLAVAGDLTLAATEVVPSTGASYTIADTGNGASTVAFSQLGRRPTTPLSVDGSLSVSAANIVQGGSIISPFGSIALSATRSLTLLQGSYTSVSGGGVELPYGRLDNGTSWQYGLQPALTSGVTAIPSRQIALNGARVTLAKGATVDVSGGGDLTAYQWTPGTGGTKDALAPAALGGTPGLYAILPSLRGQFAPYDPLTFFDSGITPGQSIYLSGGAGLPAGFYPLLPARYALLPGAFLVSPQSGFADLRPGTTATATNGAPVIAGYMSFGTTGLGGQRFSGFALQPGSYAFGLADYTNVAASDFFAQQAAAAKLPRPVLPADAGTLIVAAQVSLAASGSVVGKGAAGGEGALVEVSGPSIQVDPGIAQVAAGTLQLSAAELSSWDPSRVLLGGTYTGAGRVTVSSNDVSVAPGAALHFDEVVIVANDGITVGAGASVESNSALTDRPPAAGLSTPVPLTLASSGSAAPSALAVSDLSALAPVAVPVGAAAAGAVQIDPGARVSSRGSITISALGGAQLADGAISGVGAQWNLAGSHVVFGQSTSTPGSLVIDASLRSGSAAAGSLAITSASTIDFAEAVAVGGSGLHNLVLSAQALQNLHPGATSQVDAENVTLQGFGTSAAAQPGAGTLTVNARSISLAGRPLTVSAFDRVNLLASGPVTGRGAGGIMVPGDLNVTGAVLTAASGANAVLEADAGAVTIGAGHGAVPRSSLVTGGGLTIAGQTVEIDAPVIVPSGLVTVSAAGNIGLGSAAVIDTSGLMPSVAGLSHGSEGGSIGLNAGGSISAAPGSRMMVSAAQAADAGSISVVAQGGVNLRGTLAASSDSGHRGGEFAVAAGTLEGFAGLNAQLEAGGFTGARSFETRTGDLDLPVGNTISARQVTLTADQGSVTIAGAIDSSGSGARGSIVVNAGQNLSVADGASLQANATDSGARGGLIQLTSVAGTLTLAPGASVSAHGAGESGQLILRAGAEQALNDVSLSGVPADLSRVDQLLIEPVLAFPLASGAPSAADLSAIQASAAAFTAASSGGVLTRLGLAGRPNVVFEPYLDLTYGGDLALGSVDLTSWRFNGVPGTVAFRAGGMLTLSGTIADGTVSVQGPDGPKLDVMGAQSSGVVLVAGADFGAAGATATVGGAPADLVLTPGSAVETGTGDVVLAASRDVVLAGSSVFTVGMSVPQAPTSNAPASGRTPSFYASYPTGGGDVTVLAGRDVLGSTASTPAATQNPNDWLPREFVGTAASWGIDATNFAWNLGTLGGGDVAVRAGRDAVNVAAAVANSMYVDATGRATAYGGGNLVVTTGRDELSGAFYVGNGTGTIDTTGALGSGRTDANGNALGTVLFSGNASFSIAARGDVTLEGELTPSSICQSGRTCALISPPPYFYQFSPGAALDVTSSAGTIDFETNITHLAAFIGNNPAQFTDSSAFLVAPPNVDLSSFAGDIRSNTFLTLFPADRGQLSVYASGDVSGGFRMSDTAANLVATPATPVRTSLAATDPLITFASSARHTGDTVPAFFYAGRDILALIYLPKAASIYAGRDILDPQLSLQNANDSDTSVLSAGRNIIYDPSAANLSINIGGGGQFDVLAGGRIDLGYATGITTYGNFINSNLATTSGAGITILPGLGAAPNAAGFLSAVVAPSPTYSVELTSYVGKHTGQSGLTYSAAARQFLDWTLAQQLPVLTSIFFDVLVQSGRQANSNPQVGFTQGFAAINALFPGSTPGSSNQPSPYLGDLSLAFSRIYTLNGGSIDILVPGGAIDVGLANPPPSNSPIISVPSRAPSQLGIVAEQAGNVDIFALGDVNVNSSRVFTLGGGNIAIWSSEGNIDAGRGAKTSVSAPPPTVIVDANGTITINYSAAVAGSGIRTIQTNPLLPPGDVDLDAPHGIVNAGDAGIGAAGNLNVAAQGVAGLDNIQVGGTSTGVPPIVGNIGVTLSAASSAASSSSAAATSSVAASTGSNENVAALANSAMGWLDVFVTGLGEEACRPDDVECLKRQPKH